MSRFLGRLSGWAVTNPAPTVAIAVAIVAILAVVAALRLTPDAGTDKLVDSSSPAFEGTEEYRERFGDDAIVVLARADLSELVLTEELAKLFSLEGCLAGNALPAEQLPKGVDPLPDACHEIAELDAVRGVFGPATFLNTTAQLISAFEEGLIGDVQAQAQAAAAAAAAAAQEQGLSEAEVEAAASGASQAVLIGAFQQFGGLAKTIGGIGGARIDNPEFVAPIVFDSEAPAGTPKARFGYLFPSRDGALVSIRLEPGIDDDERRRVISLIREAVYDDAFALAGGGSYEISGVPVVVEGLADKLGDELLLLFGLAVAVMALTLLLLFGPPLRLLPLVIALGAAGVAFGILGIAGGSLTMASVAVLPVVIGLGVDYAIQLQARFREAAEAGRRPAAAAVFAAVRGGPVIATAALASAAGFLALLLSPIPMVREFAVALVVGVAAALLIALTAGLAALSMPAPPSSAGSGAGSRLAPLRRRLGGLGMRVIGVAIAAPGRVLLVAAVFAAGGWVASSEAEIVSDIRELVPDDLAAIEGLDALQEVTGVSGELNVIVRGDGVTSPVSITWMRDFKKRVLFEHGFTAETVSCRDSDAELCPGPAISDLFSDERELDENRIDSVLAVVPPYFQQAILSTPEAAEQVASIGFLIPVMPLDEQEQLIDEIRAEITDLPPGIDAEVVGLPVLAAEASGELSDSRHWLALAGLAAVALVLLSIYRSLSRALVPLIPIALATGWSALVLAALGIPLNPMSATLGALVIAIATEFSVILSARYREQREAGNSVGEALRETYSRTGSAVLASGITSVAGFGVLIASEITMLRDFGIVTVVDLLVALIGVIVVLPAALVWADTD